jgi:N-acetylornithine carbamoyltransferase
MESSMERFTDLGHFTRGEIADLLRLAARLERAPEPDALRGRVLGMLFLDPSIQTRASFQAAMARLGGASFVIAPDCGTWRLELRDGVVMDGDAAEHVREAIPTLASYGDALGVRVFAGRGDLDEDLADSVFNALADACPVPIINMGSAVNHPCQGLADWKTLDELGVPRRGGKLVLSWARHVESLPLAVPATVVHMAAMRGMEVTVLRPEGYGLPEPLMEKATRAAAESGGMVFETSDRQEALEGAHILYARSWSSPEAYGDAAKERMLREGLESWCVDESWFRNAQPGARFMHCLPVRRGVVVADAVLDGRRSVVVRQARNRIYVQMAILQRMLRGRERSRGST